MLIEGLSMEGLQIANAASPASVSGLGDSDLILRSCADSFNQLQGGSIQVEELVRGSSFLSTEDDSISIETRGKTESRFQDKEDDSISIETRGKTQPDNILNRMPSLTSQDAISIDFLMTTTGEVRGGAEEAFTQADADPTETLIRMASFGMTNAIDAFLKENGNSERINDRDGSAQSALEVSLLNGHQKTTITLLDQGNYPLPSKPHKASFQP